MGQTHCSPRTSWGGKLIADVEAQFWRHLSGQRNAGRMTDVGCHAASDTKLNEWQVSGIR